MSKDISIGGTVSVTGGKGAKDGGDGTGGSGGGGAGGSVLYVCATATLGTTKTTSSGGTTEAAGSPGGSGSVGRIALHHSGTVTGTTTPTFTDISDATLVESSFEIPPYAYIRLMRGLG